MCAATKIGYICQKLIILKMKETKKCLLISCYTSRCFFDPKSQIKNNICLDQTCKKKTILSITFAIFFSLRTMYIYGIKQNYDIRNFQ